MTESHGKSKAKKESKTEKLNRIGREWRRIQEQLDDTNSTITSLEAQYQADATSRRAYQKSTYQNLSAAYEKRDALSTEIEQKKAAYNAVEAELESSSGDESRKSVGSGSSGGGYWSSGSSAPTNIGWDCGAYGGTTSPTPGH